MNKNFKSGFVAIIGKPNVGKSTLINNLVGQKISITGPKPQTTRNKILGIRNDEDSQIVFVDTPGIIKPKNQLEEFMELSIKSALDGIDLLVYVIDATKITDKDYKLVEYYKDVKVPIILVINKIDISKFEDTYPKLAKFNEYGFIKEFISLSALTGKHTDELVEKIKKHLPVGVPFFGNDEITDKTESFLCAELVREKALLYLQQEIPHGIAVDIIRFKEQKVFIQIDAEIICTKQNHKQIIIGAGGEMLKKIGIASRIDMETMLGKKVNLKIFVKVRENWQDNKLSLREYGYDKKGV